MARCTDRPGEGVCQVRGSFYPEGNYWILDTDYETYTLVYGCDQWIPFLVHTENAWILSRTKTLPQAKIDEIEAKLKRLVPHYDTATHWEATKQEGDCKYNEYSP